MSKQTLPAELLAAYMATEYRCVVAEAILRLRIDQTNPALDELLHTQGWDGGAFLSNANPRGEALSERANAQRNAALQRGLLQRGLPHWPGLGVPDEPSPWQPEPSFLIVGLSLESAQKMAAYCEQLAFVWHPQNGRTRLCLTGLEPKA